MGTQPTEVLVTGQTASKGAKRAGLFHREDIIILEK